MQKLFVHILAFLRRILPANKAVSTSPAPRSFRPRQVAPAPASKVYLKLLSPSDRKKFGLMTASVGAVAIAGFTAPALAQSEESCAFIYELRSPYTIERVLTRYPNDPCIPMLLDALSPDLLSRINVKVIAALPPAQLNKVPKEVLQQLGIQQTTTTTTTRAVPRTTRYRAPTSNNNTSNSSTSSGNPKGQY